MELKLILSTGKKVDLTVEELKEIISLREELSFTHYPTVYPWTPTEPIITYNTLPGK